MVALLTTERSLSVTSSVPAYRSCFLIRSQEFPLSLLIRTRANSPFSFSPCRINFRSPFCSPSRKSLRLSSRSSEAAAWKVPASQMITSPAP